MPRGASAALTLCFGRNSEQARPNRILNWARKDAFYSISDGTAILKPVLLAFATSAVLSLEAANCHANGARL